MHEGDRYFEHCYAADFDVRIARRQQELCWQAWIAHYTKHQPSHRVDYALRRIEALENGEPEPSLPGLASAPDRPTRPAAGLDAAVVITQGGMSSLSPVADDAGAVPNGCAQACSVYEARCRMTCPDASDDCVKGCERERATCLLGCY